MKIQIRRKFRSIAAAMAVIIGLLALLMNPQASSGQNKQPETPISAEAAGGGAWNVRCSADEGVLGRECEAFQRLLVVGTGQRVVEFAVGFPGDRKEGRGVIILPLGILLNEDIFMQIDDGQKYRFKPHYCTNEGCFSFITAGSQILDGLHKGSIMTINARAINGKDLKIKMTLKGLSKVLKAAEAGG